MWSIRCRRGTAGPLYRSLFLLGSVTGSLLVNQSPPLTMKNPEQTQAGVIPFELKVLSHGMCTYKKLTCTENRSDCQSKGHVVKLGGGFGL